MKLRYYLRGLGIGIVVTAIIMSFTRQPEKLTDAQIKMRALELGMVEESVLADLQKDKETASNEEHNIPAFEDIVEVEVEDEESENKVEEETEVETDSNIEGSSDAESDVETDVEEDTSAVKDDSVVEHYILISVEGGNDSFTVSEKLYEAGLVNSATEFNQYLVRNGYDRRLRTGNHEIPADATEEEMAKILCNMQ